MFFSISQYSAEETQNRQKDTSKCKSIAPSSQPRLKALVYSCNDCNNANTTEHAGSKEIE